MILAQAPLRISFVGGGTDYPSFYRVYGGEVISTAINWKIFVTASEFPNQLHGHRHKLFYSKIESPKTTQEIEHPILKEIIKLSGDKKPIEVHSISDVPAKTGLGSSSSFTVAALYAINALVNNDRKISKEYLLTKSLEIEQDILAQTVGSQDQAIAVHGGFKKIRFNTSGVIETIDLGLPEDIIEKLQSSMYLVYTGSARKTKSERKPFENPTDKVIQLNHQILDLVQPFEHALRSNCDLQLIGEILKENWELKKQISKEIFSKDINKLYSFCNSIGASGGKLLGAGGGGFFLFVVENEKQKFFEMELEKSKTLFFKPLINQDGVGLINLKNEF